MLSFLITLSHLHFLDPQCAFLLMPQPLHLISMCSVLCAFASSCEFHIGFSVLFICSAAQSLRGSLSQNHFSLKWWAFTSSCYTTSIPVMLVNTAVCFLSDFVLVHPESDERGSPVCSAGFMFWIMKAGLGSFRSES